MSDRYITFIPAKTNQDNKYFLLCKTLISHFMFAEEFYPRSNFRVSREHAIYRDQRASISTCGTSTFERTAIRNYSGKNSRSMYHHQCANTTTPPTTSRWQWPTTAPFQGMSETAPMDQTRVRTANNWPKYRLLSNKPRRTSGQRILPLKGRTRQNYDYKLTAFHSQ